MPGFVGSSLSKGSEKRSGEGKRRLLKVRTSIALVARREGEKKLRKKNLSIDPQKPKNKKGAAFAWTTRRQNLRESQGGAQTISQLKRHSTARREKGLIPQAAQGLLKKLNREPSGVN